MPRTTAHAQSMLCLTKHCMQCCAWCVLSLACNLSKCSMLWHRICAASCWLLPSEVTAVQILALLLGNCFNDVIAFLGGCLQAFACLLFLSINFEGICMLQSSASEASRESLQVPSALRP